MDRFSLLHVINNYHSLNFAKGRFGLCDFSASPKSKRWKTLAFKYPFTGPNLGSQNQFLLILN